MGTMESFEQYRQLQDVGCWDAEDDDLYCIECGSDELAYVEQTANGQHYKCLVCGAEI